MKYGKFVCTKELPFTQREIDHFVVYFKNLIKKYDDSLELKVYESESSLTINFRSEKKAFRNKVGSRIVFEGIVFQLFKERGYLDNWDWGNNTLIDPNKERENYQDAPKYQYSCRMFVYGTEIPYRRRTKYNCIFGCVMPNYLYGTEFNDLDYSEIVESLFQKVLCPIGKY